MLYQHQVKKKKGYVVISTVLILLFVTLGISATLSFLSLGNAKSSLSLGKGQQAFFLSDACLEEGLLRLKTDITYSGGTVNFSEGQCTLEISTDNGIYTAKAFFDGGDGYVRSIEAQVQVVDGILQMISWEEKPFVIN